MIDFCINLGSAWYSYHKSYVYYGDRFDVMAKPKNRHRQIRAMGLFVFGMVGFGLVVAHLVGNVDVAIFNPKGRIAEEQLELILVSVALMLVVAVPTLILLYFIAWKYRESNEKAAYDPHARHGKLIVTGMWAIPSIFMLMLAMVMWPATNKLEPRKPIASDAKPLTIKVIAMRWKWVFIYPEQNIATVNYVQVPVGTPIEFDLTADEAPMSSFWIPHLGGQLYAMTGHVNRLNLIAEEPGDYPGSSAEINGAGFAGMKFIARASSRADFDLWVRDTQRSSGILNSEEYGKLLKASENNPAAFYSKAESDLLDKLLLKYNGPNTNHTEEHQ